MHNSSTDSGLTGLTGLKSLSAGIALATVALFNPLAHAEQNVNKSFAYVGTYNPNGEGVYRLQVDPKTGELTEKTLVSSLANPAQLVVDAQGKPYTSPVRLRISRVASTARLRHTVSTRLMVI